MPLELIDQFLYEAKIGFKLIKIHPCKAEVSVMRVGSRTPATSKMEFFMTIIKKWKLLNIVPKRCNNGYEKRESIALKSLKITFEEVHI